ncbi:hypothetical protein ACOSQ2_024116 [Xanthoceras sorbifolium]
MVYFLIVSDEEIGFKRPLSGVKALSGVSPLRFGPKRTIKRLAIVGRGRRRRKIAVAGEKEKKKREEKKQTLPPWRKKKKGRKRKGKKKINPNRLGFKFFFKIPPQTAPFGV